MKLTNEFEPIRQWANDRSLYLKGDIQTQYLKLLEEAGELSKAILKRDQEEIIDAIGDCVVVLTNLSHFANVDIEYCINSAFDQIKNRKGSMINGTFVKNDV